MDGLWKVCGWIVGGLWRVVGWFEDGWFVDVWFEDICLSTTKCCSWLVSLTRPGAKVLKVGKLSFINSTFIDPDSYGPL